MAANHKMIGFGKLDGSRAESKDDITLKQKVNTKNSTGN